MTGLTTEDERENYTNDMQVYSAIENALHAAKGYRPQERSERSRGYAICITELEKIEAYFFKYVMNA